MTPIQIEILLHYHCFPEQYRNGDFSAPAVKDALEFFEHRNILIKDPKGYVPNHDALSVYIAAICKVPLPIVAWTIPDA